MRHAALTSSKLKSHKESKHHGIRYPCDKCEFAAPTAYNDKKLKELKHEGVRYPWIQCYLPFDFDKKNS